MPSVRGHWRRLSHRGTSSCGNSGLLRQSHVLWTLHPTTHFRKRFPHRLFARAHEVACVFEIVVFESGNVRLDHKIGCTPPQGSHSVLRDGERLYDHVKEMTRGAISCPLSSQMNRQHALSAHLAQRLRGHG